MATQTIIWVHADNLHPRQAAFQAAPDAPALFVWDDELLRQWAISLKRVVFIYECLLDLPVTIRRGESVAEQVLSFAREHDATRLLTASSPSPRHRAICDAITAQAPDLQLDILSDPPFVDSADFSGEPDLKRMTRYWRQIRDAALR